MTPRPSIGLLLGIGLLSACGGRDAPEESGSAVDSAGVEIVTLGTRPAASWSVDPEPAWEVGSEQGDDPFLFEGVVGASRVSDGSTLVCNAGDRTLRRYDRDGRYLGAAGGQGGGPSELRLLGRCFHAGGKTWAYQAPFQPIKVFEGAGALARTVPMPRPGDRPAMLMDVLAEGVLLLRQDAPRRDLREGSDALATAVIVASGPLSEPVLDTIWVTTAGRWVREGPLAFPQAFTPSLWGVAAGGLIVVSWPATFDLAVMTPAGRLVRRIRSPLEPVRATERHRRAFEERILTGPMPAGDTPYQSDDVRRTIVEMMEYLPTLPAHHRLLVDGGGDLWVERGDAPRDPLPQVAEPYPDATTWDVLSVGGAWIAMVVLPPRFDPLEIGEDYVLGVHHDELGVERVRSYPLQRER